MEPITSIEISCQGNTTVELDELNDLQGNLKDLTDEDYAKLRNSIVTYGFSFPVFIWVDQEGKKWTLDANQRKRTLQRMREEGITIPPLPADIIQAKDKTQAKEKILLLNSQYGKITEEGLYEFINEEDSKIDETIGDMLSIPEWDKEFGTGEEESGDGKKKEITCPACQHVFVP